MKIVEKYPPNINEIRKHLNPHKETVFTYGDTIYNPSGKNLLPDVIEHEKIHMRQQAEYTSPEIFFQRYLNDKEFRLETEKEAYGEQYLFAKKHITDGRLLSWLRENIAMALSSEDYGNMISYGKAESFIRNYGKI